MGICENVFGSNKEKHLYQELCKTWGNNYKIYHNLPFLNVFTVKTDETLICSDEEYEKLKKTSIDFTLCDKKDTPLVCVEFDGFQGGFNVGKTYHRKDGSLGKMSRRAFIELKLRIAHESQFPYLVLGSDEFSNLSDTIRLTIADGLIGEVMSSRNINKQINAGFDPRQCGYSIDEFDALSQAEQSEIFSNWVTMIELDSDFKYNPITQKAAQLQKELHAYNQTLTFLNDGKHDPDKWVWVECEVSNHNGKASAKVCLPDFKTPYCYATVHVAIEIAHLLSLEQLRKHKNK